MDVGSLLATKVVRNDNRCGRICVIRDHFSAEEAAAMMPLLSFLAPTRLWLLLLIPLLVVIYLLDGAA